MTDVGDVDVQRAAVRSWLPVSGKVGHAVIGTVIVAQLVDSIGIPPGAQPHFAAASVPSQPIGGVRVTVIRSLPQI